LYPRQPWGREETEGEIDGRVGGGASTRVYEECASARVCGTANGVYRVREGGGVPSEASIAGGSARKEVSGAFRLAVASSRVA
jgi:hypothetical protein